MSFPDDLPASFNARKPSVARMYDYFLGGKDNFEADRRAADEILRLSPSAPNAAFDNRRFLGRAVEYLASSGITQFIDIGSGLPTMDNTHEIAARANPLSRVVYVDNDPVAVTHGRAILAEDNLSVAVSGDLREPRRIMQDPELLAFLDMSRPVAVILAAILHFLDDTQAYAAVDYLKDAIPAGSAIVISHATADDATSEQAETVESVYAQQAATPIYLRPLSEVRRFFDGFELAGPGVTDINALQADSRQETQTIGYGGIGRKP